MPGNTTPKCVPLTMGSPRFYTLDAGPFKVTEAWFPADLVLSPHLHDRTTFAVMLEGSFDLSFSGTTYACPPSTVFTEPLGDKHGNRLGYKGAHVLILQPDHEQTELFRPCQDLFDCVTHFQHGGITGLAWRLARELRTPDNASSLAIQGLGMEILATAARIHAPHRSPTPAWLLRVEELIHARFREKLTVTAVAREAGVHPVHVARVFRMHYRESIGAFIRRLRLEWAARQLATSEDPIAQIALDAGFADQSHFTRSFKNYIGVTPGLYRKELRA